MSRARSRSREDHELRGLAQSRQPPLPSGVKRVAAIGLAVLLLPIPSGGQEATGEPVEEVGPPAEIATEPVVVPPPGIEAIEVTGESLSATNVQDEAEAITAFDTGALDRLQIGNVDRLALNVPGLHVGQQGQNAIITLRGVGTENASLTGEAGVAFHVDGIYYGSLAAARAAFFDIEGLEVKRGPQGFQGGKNSTSGAIHVNTRDPQPEYEVSGDYLFGNYDRQRGRGAINVPLGEFFAARLALFYEERDGYLDRQRVRYPEGPDLENPQYSDVSNGRDPFDVDNFGLRGKLRFLPSDSLDFVVGYNYFKETGVGPQADIVPLDRQACPPGRGAPAGASTRMGILGGCATPPTGDLYTPSSYVFYPVTEDVDPRKILTDFGSSQNDRYWGFSGTLRWDVPQLPLVGETHLKLLGGFQRSELDFNQDFDGSDQEYFNIFLDNTRDEHTAELQWSGGERLSWQGSVFFQRQTGEQNVLAPGSELFPNPDPRAVFRALPPR